MAVTLDSDSEIAKSSSRLAREVSGNGAIWHPHCNFSPIEERNIHPEEQHCNFSSVTGSNTQSHRPKTGHCRFLAPLRKTQSA